MMKARQRTMHYICIFVTSEKQLIQFSKALNLMMLLPESGPKQSK